MLLPLWIEASKPYWDIVDDWISTGNLLDPCNEFFIRRFVHVVFMAAIIQLNNISIFII